MIITPKGVELRNLQEQVLKNKDDIATILQGTNIAELGIKIINAEDPYPSVLGIPNFGDPSNYPGDYGDGYIVGSGTPYTLYIYSRSSEPGYKGFWFNWGELNAPSIVPGPIGPQGIQGETGTRGSLWYSQSGAPTNTTNVLPNDQALDTSAGNVYQFVNNTWQYVGNIRGPQGIRGIQGIPGTQGIPGPVGPQGPKGDQGQFIQIIGTLDNINQLPMPDSVPRYAAYLIPVNETNHIYLLTGEGTTESPILWTDAGSIGSGGSKITVDGVTQSEVEIGYVPKISTSYQLSEDTVVTSSGSEITLSNMQTTGYNVNNEQIEGTGTIELPFSSDGDIEFNVLDNKIVGDLSMGAQETIENLATNSPPLVVQITAPTTSTNGQLTVAQLETLQGNRNALLFFNKEVYRLEDEQHTTGYLVYSHIGYENTTNKYVVKCITITISTRGWVLTTKEIKDPITPPTLYRHFIKITYDNDLSGDISFEVDNYNNAQYTSMIDINNDVFNGQTDKFIPCVGSGSHDNIPYSLVFTGFSAANTHEGFTIHCIYVASGAINVIEIPAYPTDISEFEDMVVSIH